MTNKLNNSSFDCSVAPCRIANRKHELSPPPSLKFWRTRVVADLFPSLSNYQQARENKEFLSGEGAALINN